MPGLQYCMLLARLDATSVPHCVYGLLGAGQPHHYPRLVELAAKSHRSRLQYLPRDGTDYHHAVAEARG